MSPYQEHNKALTEEEIAAMRPLGAIKPKFRIGEKIKWAGTDFFAYEVFKTPETCVHNDLPSYLIQSLQHPGTPAFHRSQRDVEEAFVSVDDAPSVFGIRSHIRHKKTGGIYEIETTPDKGRLEETNEPAYFYRSLEDGIVWARRQTEVEDGRFEAVLLGDPSAV